MHSKTVLVTLLGLLLLASMTLNVVYADYYDGFETYAPGTISPVQFGNNVGWSFSQLSTTCGSAITGTVGGGATNGKTAFQGTQFYSVLVGVSCVVNDYGKITLAIMPSSYTVTLTVQHEENLTADTATVVIVGSTTFTEPGSTTWTSVYGTSAATPGVEITVGLECKVLTTVSTAQQSCNWDNVIITGGSLLNTFNTIANPVSATVIGESTSCGSPCTSTSITTTNGNIFVVGVATHYITTDLTASVMSDTSSFVWKEIPGSNAVLSPTTPAQVVWFATNITSTGTDTITVTIPTSGSQTFVSIYELTANKTIADYKTAVGSGSSNDAFTSGITGIATGSFVSGILAMNGYKSIAASGGCNILSGSGSDGSTFSGGSEYIGNWASGCDIAQTFSVSTGTYVDSGIAIPPTAGNNLNLIDFANQPNLFNIVKYSGAANTSVSNALLYVDYASGQQYVIKNLSAPDLELPTTATITQQITVYVNSNYYRSVIPDGTSTTNGITTILMDAPNLVSSYLFQFNNPSQTLASSDRIYFYAGSQLITSGYLDAGLTFATWLRATTYQVEIFSPTGNIGTLTPLFDSSISVSPSTTSSQTIESILVSSQSVKFIPTLQGNVSIALTLTGTNTLTSSYRDISNTTTIVNMTLYTKNVTGTFSTTNCLDNSSIRPAGCTAFDLNSAATSTFSPIQFNNTGVYTVTFTIRQYYNGVNQSIVNLGPYFISNGTIGGTTGADNNAVLGFSAILLGSFNSTNDIILDIISLLIILSIAEGFSGKYANFGVLVVVIVTGVFLSKNWINLTALGVPSVVLVILGVMAVLQYTGDKEKEAENVYDTVT